MKKINIKNGINKYYVIIGSISILVFIGLLLFAIKENTKQYLVENGYLEYTEITTAYIIKKEVTIEKDKSKVLVPVIADGARVSKGDIIATYKGEEYKNYEQTLNNMDKEILELMQHLPAVYSSEVDAIENIIHDLVKESISETSYNKMQEYKQKINTNINKRAVIIGELSPDGAKIKELIQKRNEYEAQAKKSNDNILATMPGIVSYVTDGLENKFDYSNIQSISYDDIKDIVSSDGVNDNTKIKIVNNYEAYIVVKASLESQPYMEEGYDYRLRLIEQNNYELLGVLEKINVLDDKIEAYFKVTNGIEHIIDLREAEIEIVWDHSSGMIIPSKALYKYENKEAYYVMAIRGQEYVNIPVNIRIKNDNRILVKNYTEEELDNLKIDSDYNLKLYDRVIMETKNRRNK